MLPLLVHVTEIFYNFFSQLEFLGLNNPAAISNVSEDPVVVIKSPDLIPERLISSDDLDLVKSLIEINKEVDAILESYDTGGKVQRDEQTTGETVTTNLVTIKKLEKSASKKQSKKAAVKQVIGTKAEEGVCNSNPKLVLERSEACPVHGDVSVWTSVCNHSTNA